MFAHPRVNLRLRRDQTPHTQQQKDAVSGSRDWQQCGLAHTASGQVAVDKRLRERISVRDKLPEPSRSTLTSPSCISRRNLSTCVASMSS